MHEEGGTEGFLREVLSIAEDARHVPNSMAIGCETSFDRYFRKPDPMRPPDKARRVFWRWRGGRGLLEDIPASGVGRDGV